MKSESDRNLCLFRQMEAADDPSDALEVSADPTPDDIVCKLGGCGLTLGHLVEYVTAAGAAEPRNALDSVVAPSCAMLDVPHDADRDLGDMWDRIFDSPDEV